MRGEKDQSESRNIMSTHPLTSERIVAAEQLASEAAINGGERSKDVFISEIDGLIFGDDPEQGIRRGRVFEHPGLAIRFEVPPGFTLINTPQRVIAKGEDGSVIVFDNANAKKVREVGGITNYMKAVNFKGAKFRDVENLNINGMAAVTGTVKLSISQQKRDIRLLIYRFWFETQPDKTQDHAVDFRRTTYSFKHLSPSEIAAIKPLRVRVIDVGKGDTVETLAKKMPMEKFRLEWFELLNDVERDAVLKTGSRVRLVSE